MALSSRIFSTDTSLRPALACEITQEGVIAARLSKGEVIMAFASLADPLSPDVVRPGLAESNFSDQALVVAALRKALDELEPRDKTLTLVVPDAAVRVLILDFDSLPPRLEDALPIVRIRLRKLAPFEVDNAAVSYQVIRQSEEQTRTLVTIMPAPIRAEYEGAVRAAGYEPGVVLPSMLASLASIGSSDAALVVNRSGLSLTTAITNGDELLLHRTLELPADYAAQHEELAQVVTVATAYFEDTMNTTPRVLYYNGPGGAEGFADALRAEIGNLKVLDLVPKPATGALTSLPKGLAAGVMGALAS